MRQSKRFEKDVGINIGVKALCANSLILLLISSLLNQPLRSGIHRDEIIRLMNRGSTNFLL